MDSTCRSILRDEADGETRGGSKALAVLREGWALGSIGVAANLFLTYLILLARLKGRQREIFEETGLTARIGGDRFCPTVRAAVASFESESPPSSSGFVADFT